MQITLISIFMDAMKFNVSSQMQIIPVINQTGYERLREHIIELLTLYNGGYAMITINAHYGMKFERNTILKRTSFMIFFHF